jgi:integrative and conjugative element protein (TIGR02256 family)
VIWVPDCVLSLMVMEANAREPLETGGALLGYWAGESSEPVVTHFVGPGPDASHGKDRFEPDYDYQNAEIERLYSASGRTLHYLGDWHSHPNGGGYLSDKDRATFLRIARSKGARAARPVMIVLAGKEQWAAHAWQLERRSGWFLRRPAAVSLAVKAFSIGNEN